LIDETDLIDRLSRGERPAFRELVDLYKKKVYYLALDVSRNAADAEDISQEVFLKAFRSFGTFRKGAKLGSWLYRITYNTCLDYLRRRSLYPEAAETDVLDRGEPVEPGPARRQALNPGQLAEQRLLRERVDRALLKLSVQERTVFTLRHDEDLMLDEIARVMDISIGSVKSYLFRGLQKLRREMAEVLNIPKKEGVDERL
jgi:RNA polymerase sigma-70 factor (ECF subfamily)